MSQHPPGFWSVSVAELLLQLRSTPEGLSSEEAAQRLARFGANLLRPRKKSDAFSLLLSQFKSPIILILLFATGMSFFLHDPVDASIILAIVLVSGLLGYWQERGAENAVEKLLAIVQIKAMAVRDDTPAEILVERIVPGDVVVLSAGDVIPGDCRILESKDLFVDEAPLTGETYPVEKSVTVLAAETPLPKRTNALWMGTHVISGSGKAVVVLTGKETEFGKVSERLNLGPQETEFERGIRRFGYFLMEVTLLLVIAIFAANVYLLRPVMDSFLFSLALAVGLTPQLLPAIISINLAHGAKRMASEKVIVKRLASIENFGSMNILCSDKTGTLTEGTVQLQSAVDVDGAPSEKVLFHAYLNAYFETGFTNPVDDAIRSYRPFDLSAYQKRDEIPYDFLRKRLSILVSHDGGGLMVTKGTVPGVLDVCSSAEVTGGTAVDIAAVRERITRRFAEYSGEGYRTLGIACKEVVPDTPLDKKSEAGMTFLGFLVLFDPPKPGIAETIGRLKSLGVSMKMITGDNSLVASHVLRQIGVQDPRILTGHHLREASDEAVLGHVAEVDAFAEVEPNQKERIILALKKAGNVVGYMGDGINDASALHSADVGISVESAVDVAKEAADIVLLEKDLGVLVQGVREGRITFANTLKYVFMATSANFGNMFSMAGASLFLPFLPLLPKQILLTNLMTDVPEMTIATDAVDSDMVARPRRWDIGAIRKFMLTFGILSSVFDYLTFGLLVFVLHATPELFRTGWFLESVVSASTIVLVIRSRKTFFRSRPGKYLMVSTFLVVIAALALPFTPVARLFDFRPLTISFVLLLGGIVALYITATEIMKKLY
ncbi:MAG TPA: magnesium-translocating P-type ATPase, partial [Candidatus Deferrimicrobiaceae bacterium]|nr:magnesium-translocating P-type ATPase [Candidatus Deferrimicrobiaceae bacterium]